MGTITIPSQGRNYMKLILGTFMGSRVKREWSSYRGCALDDVATVVALAGHQPEPFSSVLVLAKFLF